jgi:ribosomal protein S18 acetylase RimI-like enzyme
MTTLDPFQLRRAAPGDRDAAYAVCLQTGRDGQDATALYQDPRALGHLFVGPYLALEPELAFVLEDPVGVCGYVLGALDSRRFYRAYLDRWLPELRPDHPAPTGDPASWTLTERLYHEYHHPDVYWPEPHATYPSHLHIDLLPRAQGRGWGRRMVERLLHELAARGSPGVHLGVGEVNARAVAFYHKLGFERLTQRRDVLYLVRRLSAAPLAAA